MSNVEVMPLVDGLDWLTATLARMGGTAESQVMKALDSVGSRNVDLAAQVVEADEELDQAEAEIEQRVIQMLNHHQNRDERQVRELMAATKIASDLERIGDYAVNIARRVPQLAQAPSLRPARNIARMGQLVMQLVKETLDAYLEHDVERALQAWHRDEELDDMYTSLFREGLTYMMEDPRNITACTHLLFIAKNLERIGDHATNIAENVHYLVTGTQLRDERPKGDLSEG